MRKLRNIFAIIALLSASSCAVDNVDAPSYGVNNSDIVTVIGRMTRFDDKDVTTRGVKNENEAKMTSMAMAIFPVVNNNSLGECIYYDYEDNEAELLFTITRSDMQIAQDEPYAMYIFCNMPKLGGYETKPLSEIKLADILNEYLDVENINIPQNGFPMIGSLGDSFSTSFDKDNQRFILSPIGSDGKVTVPTIAQPDGNGGWGTAEPQDILTIPMKAMFAKVNFTIEVRPDQTIDGSYSPQFTLNSYAVNNVPSTVDFSYTSNYDGAVLEGSFGGAVSGNNVASGANKIDFTFYLPERLLTAAKSLDSVLPQELRKGTYSKDVDANENGYRDEDEVYHQRFKSKMLSDDQKATNIVLSGEFRDHQNHYWDVDYTIFLGENNSTDFNIKRNSEYNNYVTIRGIQSSDDMSDNQNGIAIDHRVNVTRTQPAIISLRREVLLDSHFEVRPLRIRKSDVANIPSDITHVKVEVVNYGSAKDKSGTWWMRLERSFGVGGDGEGKEIYIEEGVSAGKRKYFTFDLITGDGTATLGDLAPLTESTEVIVPLNEGEQCVWIYVDECTEVGDAVRAGIVKVSYGSYNGTKFTPANNATYPDVSYVINQRKLFEVKYDDPSTTTDENRKYHIEYEEEYLHNFDADDDYGQTEYEGMQWGLDGIQLSYDIKAVVSHSGSWDGAKDYFMGKYIPYYDFYNSLDYEVMPTEGNRRPFAGYTFCQEIIQDINGYNNRETDPDTNIDILALNENPQSAIEYCYNKNKRNNKGQVAWTGNTSNFNWYLPAIDEIEDIVMSKYDNSSKYTYARFIDFQNKFYWSSQPAYYQGMMHYAIGNDILVNIAINDYYYLYIDNPQRARSTSVYYDNGEFKSVPSNAYGYYNILYLSGSMTNNKATNYILYDEITDGESSFSYQYIAKYEGGFLGMGSKPVYENATYTRDDFPTFDDGNKPRTSYARIRCVRKQ